MRLVKIEDLKLGMRLASSVYNDKGVLLYERGTGLVQAALNTLINSDSYGVYVLDPTEPIPAITNAELEFEKQQAIQWPKLKKILESIKNGGPFSDVDPLVNEIVATQLRRKNAVGFFQTLRGPSDQLYKHSLNVGSLSCMIAHKMGFTPDEIYALTFAALIYDIGKLFALLLADIHAVQKHFTLCWFIHTADNVHHGALSAAGRSHDRDPFALVHVQTHVVERFQISVYLGYVLQFKKTHCLSPPLTHSPLSTSAGSISTARLMGSRHETAAISIETTSVTGTSRGWNVMAST